jgi:pimeloyl-ACP methyl ester carboxylesterase
MGKYIGILKCCIEIGSSLATLRWFKLGCSLYRLKFLRAGMTEHFITVENGRVHYWTGGSGDVLVMIHGFGVDAVLNWPNQVGPMAKEYFLVIPDLIWFGESASDTKDYTPDFQAQTIEQLLRSQDIEKFHLMGHSYGGIVSGLLAAMFPDHVQKLVIVDSPAILDVVTEEEHQQTLDRLQVDSTVELLIPKSTADLRRILEMAYYKPPRVPGFVLKDLLPNYRRNVEQRTAMVDYLENDWKDVFHKGYQIEQKTLVVWGAHDVLILLKAGERVASAIGANAHLRVIQNSGHAPNLEKPKEFNRIVLDFLAKMTK